MDSLAKLSPREPMLLVAWVRRESKLLAPWATQSEMLGSRSAELLQVLLQTCTGAVRSSSSDIHAAYECRHVRHHLKGSRTGLAEGAEDMLLEACTV